MISLLVLLHYLLRQCFISFLVFYHNNNTTLSEEDLIKLYTKNSLIKLYIKLIYDMHIKMLLVIGDIFMGFYWVSWDIINWMDVIFIFDSSLENSKINNRFFEGLNRSKNYDN